QLSPVQRQTSINLRDSKPRPNAHNPSLLFHGHGSKAPPDIDKQALARCLSGQRGTTGAQSNRQIMLSSNSKSMRYFKDIRGHDDGFGHMVIMRSIAGISETIN